MTEIHITDKVVIYNDMPRGWIKGKGQPRWHVKVYDMWRDRWRRVYGDIHYFGCLIHPDFKFLSKFVEWIMSELVFEEFTKTCDKVMWCVDKDIKYPGNRDYYPEFMTLTTQIENAKERLNRVGNPTTFILDNPKPKIPVIALGGNKVLLFKSTLDARNKGFVPSHISKCLKGNRKTHKGYKWFKVNYKHGLRLRRVH